MTRVTAFLMGGLGNQLFQIFTAMAYAIRNGLEFTFQDCNILPIGTVRPTYWYNLLDGLLPFLQPKTVVHNFQKISEAGFTYAPLPTGVPNDIMFYGYFQSVHYFKDEFETILEILDIPGKLAAMKARFPDTAKQASMHFRITGYREVSHCHPVAPYEYYRWALAQIKESQVLYFHQPEDTAEVLEIISALSKEFPDKTFVAADNTLQDWEQMLLIGCCSSHINANSTFSWWGTMLGSSSNAEAEVYYPCNWFGPGIGYSIKDLVLPSWHGYAL